MIGLLTFGLGTSASSGGGSGSGPDAPTIAAAVLAALRAATPPIPVNTTYVAGIAAAADPAVGAGTTPTAIQFDPDDQTANSLSGTLDPQLYLSITSGAGDGALVLIASVAGSVNAKTGTLADGQSWTYGTPDATSTYAWLQVADGGGSGSGPGSGGGSGLTLALGTGVVVGTPTATLVAISGANLKAEDDYYVGRRLYCNAGSQATYLTRIGCATHKVTGTGSSAIHTFTFASPQKVFAAGDVLAIAGF